MITAGIDVGSSAVKAVLLDIGTEQAKKLGAEAKGKVLTSRMLRLRRRDPASLAETAFDEMLEEQELLREQVSYVATTGEGDRIAFRTGHFYSMTAHARGALYLAPDARAVLDVGGLHARALLMDDRSKVLGYRMTSQCASGSGQFLENISRYLGVTLEEIGELSTQADAPEKCSSICAVLAETDVINMVSRGIEIPNILRGIHESMASRYVRLLVASKARGKVLLTGGLAADKGLVKALRDDAAKQKGELVLETHKDSVLAGAIGAAFWGAYRYQLLQEKGVDLGTAGA